MPIVQGTDSLPPLPEGYEPLELLSSREGVVVLKAKHASGTVVLRLDTGPEARESLTELAVLSAVSHPGAAALADHGPLSGGGSYLARPFIEGQDLGAWAQGRTPEEIGRLLALLCPALDHLHRQGFVHADLKPENIIVTPEERPVLCDFGLARSREGQGRTTEGVSGTLFYLAPEELLGLELTPRADLFALGAMLHHLLVGTRRSAREFYALFPERSFLDALGTDPEDLPVWSRDLIVGLTARDPGRRPRSAAAVGRVLAERLSIELPGDELADDLRWPVSLGRDPWVAEWMNRTERGESHRSWIRLPQGETPRPLWEHLRLYAALRGHAVHGIDLRAELESVDTGLALDAWSRRVVELDARWIVVLVEELDPWSVRALGSLDRALALARRRGGGDFPALVVVSNLEAIDDNYTLDSAPAVTAQVLRGFLVRHFSSEPDARRRSFADRLIEATSGSATRLDALLTGLQRSGWILSDAEGFRLRPGDLPDALELSAGEEREGELESLASHARDLLAGLEVCGGRAPVDALARLLDDAPERFGEALLELRHGGWVEVERRGGVTQVVARRRSSGPPHGLDRARELHGRLADALEENDEDPAWVALHRYCARPDTDTEEALRRALVELRDRGRAEEALAVGDRLRSATAALGHSVGDEAPRLMAERARAWCSIGQTQLALDELEGSALHGSPELEARAALVRAQVSLLRHETEEAFQHLDRAVELDPAAGTEAAVLRSQLLHSLGKDEEVVAAVEALDLARLEAEGALPHRQRTYMESLAAMSLHRLGRADEARQRTRELIREVESSGDTGLEAALRINLSIIERTSGSLERAGEELRRCIQLYDRAGLVAGLAQARATLGGLLREQGKLVEAEPLLVSALETRERLGDTEGSGTARGLLGLLYFERGHARAAIETLEATAEGMSGAQRRRYAPLLVAKAIEMRNRIGDRGRNGDLPQDETGVDPRILLSRARIAWMEDDLEAATGLTERATALATSLKQERLAGEAGRLADRIASRPPASEPEGGDSLSALDETVFYLLRTDRYDAERVERLAKELAERGRDDRAARLYLALAARGEEAAQAREHDERASELLSACAAGLTDAETTALRMRLLGEPDRWVGDFARRSDAQEDDEDFEMEINTLLDINRRLVEQQHLDSLLGVIVEHALEVTGAERGFLVLEEHGELRFDTALDSCRGDIAQPEFEISGSVVRDALAKMEPIRVSNAVDDPLLGHQNSVVSLELRSILCVPIRIADSLRGAIYVDHRLRKGAFDDRAEKLCTLLANQAALAIQQVKRVDEIRQLNRELERRVIQKEADLQNARRALREVGAPEPGKLVGKSPVIREVQALITRAAPSDLTVLIVGQSGTGKDVAARAVHEQSPRVGGPFVSENCAALPASLIESELFGYRRGAFTGADRNRSGLFEQAHGGTLFLDEIGELPLDLQAKFLRVLETSEVRRLGDDETRSVDFRLIVATNRDLEREVREGRFRQDLFYRLQGLRIVMPPLSQRTEDIELLVEHFLRQEEAQGRTRPKVSKRVLAALARRSWPGNVRELRNEVARLCVLSEGDLDDPALISRPASLGPEMEDNVVVPIAELERRAIKHALEQTAGDKRKAADLLGISRAKIYQRLKDWREVDGDAPPLDEE